VAQQPARTRPPKYRQIADDLRGRIESGEYPADAQLPTKAELMRHYSAALATVDHAIAELRKWGLAETRQGVGTFARQPPPEDVSPGAVREQLEQLTADVEYLKEQFGRIEAHVMNLYASVGQDYPYEESAARPGQRRVAT
jgi:GntR family transcriptional regulator